jgi:hypothetical protein
MKRITKFLSSEIASKMLSEKKEKLLKLKNEKINLVVDYINSLAPKEIIDMYKKYPDYFNKDSVQVIVCGKSVGYFNCLRSKYSYSIDDQKLSDKLLKLEDRIKKLQDEIKKIKKELEVTIFKFTTYKKLREGFSEAAKFLPDDEKENLPAINISDLMDRINNL